MSKQLLSASEVLVLEKFVEDEVSTQTVIASEVLLFEKSSKEEDKALKDLKFQQSSAQALNKSQSTITEKWQLKFQYIPMCQWTRFWQTQLHNPICQAILSHSNTFWLRWQTFEGFKL